MSIPIPICFFPMKKIIIDDDKEFAESLALKIAGDNFEIFNSPRKALSFLLNDYKPKLNKTDLFSVEESDHEFKHEQKINFNFAKLKNIITDANNSDYSVLFIDHHMPEMLGIDFLKNISRLPLKKVLLTGEKDHSIAIKAFNNGWVDAYIRKDDPFLIEKIQQNKLKLEWKYFIELAEFLYELPNQKYHFLKNTHFTTTFENFIEENAIIAFCLIDTQGTFLMKDKKGHYKYFLVREKKQLNEMASIAQEDGASTQCINKLQSGLAIPFFKDLDFWNIPGKQWDTYLFPSIPVINDDSLVWTSMQYDF